MQGHLQLQSNTQRFDTAFAIKKFSFCGALFKRFWHGNEGFPKGSSWNEIVPLFAVFLFPYSKVNIRV